MPTVYHQSSSPNAMTSSFNYSSKHHQNAPHIDGLFQSKELTLVRHIEALKSVANAPLLFPNLNNSSRQNSSLLSIANSGESTDTSPLRIRPNSSSWAIDPASVPGNLRNRGSEVASETALTIEEIISRGSSVSDKAIENGDDVPVIKSRVRARRKCNKSIIKRSEAGSKNYDSNLARSSSFNANQKLSRATCQISKSVDNRDLDALTALCKGITIQEKLPNNINIKLSPYTRKSPANGSSQQSKSTAGAAHKPNNIRRVLCSSEPQLVNRKRLTSKQSEDVKTTKVFQSEQQSGIISDLGMAVPCAPPATPTAEQLRKFEYVPSLQDVRAQRAFRQRLQVMETKASQKEMRKKENMAASERLSLKERKQQHKKSQRQQIYALNKVMTDLEYQRFQTFMQGVGSG